MRRKNLTTFLGLLLFVGLTLYLIQGRRNRQHFQDPPLELKQEIAPSTEASHPIHQLISKAEKEHEAIIHKQSDTLQKAVQEYRRRYQLPPPPNFDKWYEFAKARNVQLIDEYDTIYHSLLPFWGLQPQAIRGRAQEALGYDNALLGIYIRDGKVVTAAGGTEWQQHSTLGLLEPFLQF